MRGDHRRHRPNGQAHPVFQGDPAHRLPAALHDAARGGPHLPPDGADAHLCVKLRPESVADLDGIRAVPLLGTNGGLVTLGSVAEVGVRNGYGRIFRENNERRIAVKLSVGERDLGSLVAVAQQRAATVKLPPGYRTEWTGSFENQPRAQARLAVVVPITLDGIFFLWFTAFRYSDGNTPPNWSGMPR